MERVIDIQTDGVFLSVHRGFLIADLAGENFGRIALDDIGALIVHAHGVKWSNTVFTRMSERGVPVVICGSNHAPIACIWLLMGIIGKLHACGLRLLRRSRSPNNYGDR